MSSLLRKRPGGGGKSSRSGDDEAEQDTKAPNAMKLFAKKAEAGVKASELVTSKLIKEVDAELPILDSLATQTKQPTNGQIGGRKTKQTDKQTDKWARRRTT